MGATCVVVCHGQAYSRRRVEPHLPPEVVPVVFAREAANCVLDGTHEQRVHAWRLVGRTPQRESMHQVVEGEYLHAGNATEITQS